MQTVLTKYWLTIHLAVILFASWGALLLPNVPRFVFLLWLSLMAVEAMVLLPTVRANETLAGARLRVFRSVVQDPFFYLGLFLLGVVVVQQLNSGCALTYLSDADIWQYSLPPVPWAPSCVDAKDAMMYVSVFAACFVGGLILRNSVGKTGKRFLLQGAAALSGLVACVMIWQTLGGTQHSGVAASGCVIRTQGSFFGFWLVVGMGGYVDAVAREQRATGMLFVSGVLGNFAGMLFFSSAHMCVLYTVVALLFAVYWLIYLNTLVSKAVQLKLFLMVLTVVTVGTVAMLFVFPHNALVPKIEAFFEFDKYWTALTETRNVRTEAALKIWKEHPWMGVGANGFFHYVGTVVEGKDWALIKNDQSFVLNDSLQFLCEFGVLGVSLLGAGVVALIVPVCYRARLVWQQGDGKGNDGRLFLLRVSPYVVTGVSAAILCGLESWLSNPFQSVALLTSWVFVMAILPSFLPATSRMAA